MSDNLEYAYTNDIIPDWALPSNGDYMVLNTQLCTKDGRRVGNAKVITNSYISHGINVVEVETDFGNRLVLNIHELEELFYKPTLVFKA